MSSSKRTVFHFKNLADDKWNKVKNNFQKIPNVNLLYKNPTFRHEHGLTCVSFVPIRITRPRVSSSTSNHESWITISNLARLGNNSHGRAIVLCTGCLCTWRKYYTNRDQVVWQSKPGQNVIEKISELVNIGEYRRASITSHRLNIHLCILHFVIPLVASVNSIVNCWVSKVKVF